MKKLVGEGEEEARRRAKITLEMKGRAGLVWERRG